MALSNEDLSKIINAVQTGMKDEIVRVVSQEVERIRDKARDFVEDAVKEAVKNRIEDALDIDVRVRLK